MGDNLNARTKARMSERNKGNEREERERNCEEEERIIEHVSKLKQKNEW